MPVPFLSAFLSLGWVYGMRSNDAFWVLGPAAVSGEHHVCYQGYAFAKTLASLASGFALALASKFPIIPKGVL